MKSPAAWLARLLTVFGVAAATSHVAPAAPVPVEAPRAPLPWEPDLPVYDHVVLVVEENKSYAQILRTPEPNVDTPFLNRLRAEGANLTQMYGEEHHSEGNYFWLFSGSNQGVGYLDRVPKKEIAASNLGQQLIAGGHSFKAYSEDLPAIGSKVKKSGLYVRKHAPWVSFSNLPDGATAESSSNLRFADFPEDFETLPTVAFVIPNLADDMHEGSSAKTLRAADRWLEENLGAYYDWAKTHNSLLIVTFDEDDDTVLLGHPTDPADKDPADRNRIATLLAGAHIRPGDYPEGAGVNHVSLLRTLEAMYGLPPSGHQAPLAEKAGIADSYVITDVFERVERR